MRVLGLIPARAGSKGVPGKNIRPMCGRPLLAWTVDAAMRSGVIDRLLLSTDSEEIAAVGRDLGCQVPFLRPKGIADDTTPMRDVIVHALASEADSGHAPDIVVLLQPTSPLRSGTEIAEAVRRLKEDPDADSVISVFEVPRHFSPDFVLRLEGERLKPFLREGLATRRQDARQAFCRDGSVYAFRRSSFEKYGEIYGPTCLPITVDPRRSISIDTMEDFDEAERRLTALTASR